MELKGKVLRTVIHRNSRGYMPSENVYVDFGAVMDATVTTTDRGYRIDLSPPGEIDRIKGKAKHVENH